MTVVEVPSSNTIHTSVNLFTAVSITAVSIIVLLFSYFSGVEGLQHFIDEQIPTANEG